MYGTAYYIAPEVLSGTYTEKCDMWSIGVILFIMLSGRPPFGGKQDREILEKVQKGVYSMADPVWEKRSPDAINLVKALMEKDPEKRLSAAEALEHPWLVRKVADKFDVNLALDAVTNLKEFRVSNSSTEIHLIVFVFVF